MGLEDPRATVASSLSTSPSVPAGGRAAAFGVVAVGSGRTGGPSPVMSRAWHFNAQAATVAAETSGGEASASASAWPAGRRPSDRPTSGRGRDRLRRRRGQGREAGRPRPSREAALRGRAGAGPGRAGGDLLPAYAWYRRQAVATAVPLVKDNVSP